jgi:CBS domain-containing protein
MTTSSPAANPTRAVTDVTTVGDAMSPSMIRCGPHTPLRVVARMMATHGIHAVYVIDYGVEDDETVSIWGLVSDLDLVASWPVIDQRTASSTAVQPLVTVSVDERLERAAQKMAETGSAHLAVIDPETGRPVGVLSTLDVARVIGAFPGASGTNETA